MARRVHQLAVKYHVGQQDCICTHYFAGTEGGSEAPAGMTNDFQIAMQDVLRAMFRTDITLVDYTSRVVAPVDQQSTPPHVRSVNLPGTRTDLGDALHPFVALGVTVRTDRVGRRYRGRNYWSGAQEADITVGGFTTGSSVFHGLVSAYYTQLLARLGQGSSYTASGFSGVFDWVGFSRTSLEAGAAEADYIRNVESFVVRTAPRSLRSRR